MTDFAFLTALITAIVEVLKSTFKAFNFLANDDQRGAVVRWLAGIVGALVALAFQYDVLHPVPTLMGMIASGIALGIASDILHVGIDIGKKAATPTLPGTKVTAETTGETNSGAQTVSASASSDGTPPMPQGLVSHAEVERQLTEALRDDGTPSASTPYTGVSN